MISSAARLFVNSIPAGLCPFTGWYSVNWISSCSAASTTFWGQSMRIRSPLLLLLLPFFLPTVFGISRASKGRGAGAAAASLSASALTAGLKVFTGPACGLRLALVLPLLARLVALLLLVTAVRTGEGEWLKLSPRRFPF